MAKKVERPSVHATRIQDEVFELGIAKCLLSLCYEIFDQLNLLSESQENQTKFNEAAFLLRLFEEKLESSLEELEAEARDLKAALTLPGIPRN